MIENGRIYHEAKNTLSLIYRWIFSGFIAFITLFAAYTCVSYYPPLQGSNLFTLSILLLAVWTFFWLVCSDTARRLLDRVNPFAALAVIVIIGVILRLWSVHSLDTQPVYDFSAYYQSAAAVAEGHWDELKILQGRPWGFPILLGIAFKLLGASAGAAQGLNVLLSALSICLLFLIGRQLASPGLGILAALLYCLLPSQILMNNVVNSEISFIACSLAALYFSLEFFKGCRLRDLIFTGVLLSAANLIRPVAFLYLAVFMVFLFIHYANDGWLKPLKYAGIAVLTFYLTMTPFLALKSVVYQRPIFFERGTSGIVLLMGTNPDSKGMWNADDYRLVDGWLKQYDYDDALVNSEATNLALQRIKNTSRFIPLLAVKIYEMWGPDAYGMEWANIDKEGRPLLESGPLVWYGKGLSQIFYLVMLFFLAAFGIAYRPDRSWHYLYFSGIILLVAVMHLFVEVQTRYHMPLMPLFIILLCLSLAERNRPSESLLPGR